MIHLHEPMAPGITMTALLVHRAPTVGTFHAAGISAGYRVLRPALRRVVNRLDHRVVVSKDARRAGAAAHRWRLRRAVQRRRPRRDPGRTDRSSAHRRAASRGDVRRSSSAAATNIAKGCRCCSTRSSRCRTPVDGVGGEQRSGDGGADGAPSLATRSIVWLGRISEAEKFSRLRSCDVFCAPSLGGESFGVVLIEAMAAGATVVASALDGYRNVATDGVDAAARADRATSTRSPVHSTEVLGRCVAGALALPGRRPRTR